jgi:ankyrin repeat protein
MATRVKALLEQKPSLLTAIPVDGAVTGFHLAAIKGHVDVVQVYLKYAGPGLIVPRACLSTFLSSAGADTESTTGQRQATALHYVRLHLGRLHLGFEYLHPALGWIP